MKSVKHRRAIELVTLAAVTAWLGCDPTTTPGDPGTPMFSVRGSIVSDGAVTPAHEVRAALMWIAVPDLHEFAVHSQDIPIRTEFPASFTMDLFDPPTGDALAYNDDEGGSWPAEARLAIGTLIIYEDANDSGAFEVTPEGASEYVDVVLASSITGSGGGAGVIYVEWSEPIDYDGAIFQPGFNILSIADFAVEPPDTEIVMAFDDSAWVRTYACELGVDLAAIGQVVQPEDAGAAFTEGFQCSEDGRFVEQALECEADPTTVCPESVECPYLSSSLAEGEAAPADWPCAL